ncbi:unnamed protein product, partial [Medioppia subpectinata]
YWVDETDDKIKPYFLVGGGPELFVTLMLLWLIFVVKLGPNLMADRKPFVLRKTLMIYNLMLVVINVYFAYTAAKWLDYGFKPWFDGLPARNQWSDKAVAELPDKIIYFYTKLIDLFDTIFFVLRKKSNQITFLHPYLWWKRYITRIQLLQFVIYGVAILIGLYYGLQTDYPIALQWLVIWQPFIFFYMFYRFYGNSYNKNKVQ